MQPPSHPTPPAQLDTDLELAPADWAVRETYHLLTGLVVPRPIAWVSTVDDAGVRNLAPHSYFNVVAHDPPHVLFGSVGTKDTVRNVRASGEFVLNLVTHGVLEEMNATAADLPADQDEFTWFDIAASPSVAVRPPRVRDAVAHLECRAVEEVEVGGSVLVIGEVVHLHVAAQVWRDGRVDPELLDPVARLSGSLYAHLGEITRLPRPTWDDVRDVAADERIPRR